MNKQPPVVLAASYLGSAGHGNDLTGLRPWPAQLTGAFQQGDLAELHWSLVFASNPGRFSRMDLMSRLGLMAVELLDAGLECLTPERRDQIGVCVETCIGSLATDFRFLQTPRASIFTYTLPSTVIGEICIRYHLRGPVMCLVTPPGPEQSSLAEAVHWLDQGDAEACLCVGSEAVERESAGLLPEGFCVPQWHGCAVLLGNATGEARQYPLTGNQSRNQSLAGMCRNLCRDAKHAC
jgi:3-oxoacyl-(acyl-carrier-protein) synthase